MSSMRVFPVALCLALLALAGCEREERPARRAAAASAPLPDDPLEGAVEVVARERASHMRPEGDMRRLTLGAGEHQDLAFVLKDPFCYAIIAAGGSDVTDLDLLLFDPTGVPVQHDGTTHPRPTLGLREPICPPLPGVYRVQVRMTDGEGDVAVGLYFSD
jgi:hypothetical protein